MNKRAFWWSVRVYYEDTDAGGIVYHANYLRFMERARTEWLRSLGCEQDALRNAHRVMFVVADLQVNYRRAAKFNDSLTVGVAIDALKRASVILNQSVRRDDIELCHATVRVGCIDADTLAPRPIPALLHSELACEH
ncbi:MAG: tol-pal system-associated acyl-CoA thioesterase [Gammaproteobacteria bacterium]|nr:tol-pal system-associated acyl-CoA thioesterase [Gammaproteobacteria bacterium]